MKYFLLKAYEGGNKVISNGSGGKFLADDGTYKAIEVGGSGLTTEQVEVINHVLSDYNNGKIMSDENFTTTFKNKLDSLNGERDLEVQVNTTHLQWRYVGDTVWNDLISLDELRGFTVNVGTTGQALTKKSNTSGDWEFRQLTNADVGLENVQNVDTTNIDNINESTTKKIMTDTERTKLSNAFIKNTDTTDSLTEGLTKLLLTTAERDKLNNLSGVNTGDQDLSGLVQKTTTINGNPLSSNVEIPLIDTIVSEGTGTSILRTKNGKTQNIKCISGDDSITIVDDVVNKDIKVAVNEAGLLYDNIPDGTSYKKVTVGKFDEITHANRLALDSVSGINTGDETNTTIISKIGYMPADNSNVVKLSGIQDIYGIKAFKNDAIFENITVKNIIQDGTSYESHLEQLYTEKDEIILRDKAVSALSSGVYAGLRFKKYDGTNDGLLVVGNDGVARVGDVWNTQAIATREDSPVNGKVPIWNSTTMRFETANSPTTIAGYGITDGALQGTAYSNLENNVKIVQGVPAGGKMYLGATTQTGAIKIKLPKNKTNTMFKFHVRINGYSTGGKQSNSEYVVKGYNDILGFGNTADTIATCQATVIKDNPSTMSPVFYFCTGETEDYLIIGEITDMHVYKTVIVDNVETHFNGTANDWSNGWTISLVTTLETLTSTYKVAVTPSLNATHLGGISADQYPTLTKFENNVKVIQGVPQGGQNYFENTQTGAIKIKLPSARSNTMFKFRVRINGRFEALKQSHAEYIVKGYNSAMGFGSIIKLEQQVIAINNFSTNTTFYFYTGKTEDYILIGEITDTHNVKSVVIDSVETHGNITNDWSSGWEISFVTSTENVMAQNKATVTPSLNATHLNGVQESTTGEASKIMKLGTNGEAKAQAFQVTAMNTAPASPTDTGKTGEVRITSSGVYYCVETDTWRKALPVDVLTETITGLTSTFKNSTLPPVEGNLKYQWLITSGSHRGIIESTHNMYAGSNIWSLVTGATVQTVNSYYIYSMRIGSSVLEIKFDTGSGAVSYRVVSGTITEITVNRLQHTVGWL